MHTNDSCSITVYDLGGQMENIKIGDYVRTERGFIGKIIQKENDYIDGKFKNISVCLSALREGHIVGKIIKYDKNIVQVLEDNDLVEIEYYVAKYRKRIRRIFEVTFLFGDNTIWFEYLNTRFSFDVAENKWKRNAEGHNPKIVRILTKEQYERYSYQVEEKSSKTNNQNLDQQLNKIKEKYKDVPLAGTKEVDRSFGCRKNKRTSRGE